MTSEQGLIGFEHIGMTVADIDRTIAFYCGQLGLKLVLRKPNAQGDTVFLDAGGAMLEIFGRTGPTAPASDVAPNQSGLRHLTFAYHDIGLMFEKLVSAGAEPVEAPRLAHNVEMFKRVAFVRDPDGILIELAERAEGR
ncbi:VOC family protein [Devosia rhodophyticola]|uniref:VOC family protein n=1 Tax=Devosia rhodophyticola TaxID=3026423 RepID=A0ABY7YZ56_9HYPH|nr:VOC family protein [Devosia rhodophyticola]WDR06358.1 VOC family protein [Devosia rhodophyticola]